jgi:hypothetical protein
MSVSVCDCCGAVGQKQMWCNRVSACGWRCTSFDFAEALAFLFIFLSFNVSTVGLHRVTHNDLQASDGRETEALNCKPITNL